MNQDSASRIRPGRLTLAALASGAIIASVLAPTAANATVSKPTAPASLKVERTGANTADLTISWSPVPNVDHYTVNVFDGTKDRATVVAADKTSFVFAGSGVCTRYQVRVSAVYKDGRIGQTGTYYVNSLAPGPVTNVAWQGTTLTWGDPKLPGYKPVTSYQVQVKKIATGEIIVDTKTDTQSLDVTTIDSTRSYIGKVIAFNEFGSCSSSATQLRGTERQTEAPMGLRMVRDAATPTRIKLAWDKPVWANAEGVSGYRIYYRTHGKRDVQYMDVSADTYALDLDLDADHNWDIQIKALGATKNGKMSKPVTLYRLGKATKADAAIDPEVKISESGANVVVDITGAVGSSQRYSNLDVRIAPTLNGAGLRDQQLISNGSNQITFGDVPCGVYTVIVTGQGTQAAREFGRLVVNRCNLNPADSWKLVLGKAAIAGNDVGFPTGGESRVISTLPRTSSDMVFTTDATLSAGWGYGIWARADFNKTTGMSGYSFQYDPGFGKVSSFGPALLLRVWQDGHECGNPIAKVKWPAGVDVNAKHHVVVVAQGDQLYASIDGLRMFEVASLKQALLDSHCGYAEPTGNQVGFRVWSADTRATFTNTTLS